MTTLITAIIVLASILLVFVVYIQNPKGGGLSSDFGAAQQLGGVQKTNDFIDKATWSLALIVGGLSIVLTMMTKSPAIQKDTAEETTEQTQDGGQQGGQPQGGQQNP
jgi:preprotein translocase subunit SecG